MVRFLSMIFFLLTCLVVTIATEFNAVNNTTTVELMNKLPISLIPSTYVFLIYIIIFLSFILWIANIWRSRFEQSGKLLPRRSFFFNACLSLHIVSLFLWHYELFNFMIISFIGLLLMSAALYFSYDRTDNGIATRVPISLYFGWNIFFFMFLIDYTLTLFEWTGWGISQSLWSVIFLTITTAIGLHFLYHYEDLVFNSAIMWGFVSIAVKIGFDSLFVSTASLFLTAVIIACYFIFKNRSTNEASYSHVNE